MGFDNQIRVGSLFSHLRYFHIFPLNYPSILWWQFCFDTEPLYLLMAVLTMQLVIFNQDRYKATCSFAFSEPSRSAVIREIKKQDNIIRKIISVIFRFLILLIISIYLCVLVKRTCFGHTTADRDMINLCSCDAQTNRYYLD